MRARRPAFAGLASVLIAANGAAQESQSPRLAQELGKLLEERRLESIGAVHPEEPDRVVAALYFPTTQMLAVSARPSSPAFLKEQIAKRQYRDAYLLLNSTAIQEGKFFVQDLAADGLHPDRGKDEAFDIVYESVVNRTAFDGDWNAQKLSEAEYKERFKAADERYAKMLSAMIAEVRRSPSS